MLISRATLVLALLASLGGACRRPVGAPLPPPTQCRTRSLGIGPRDVITVSVFNEANLSGDFRVGENGALNYPYLGQIVVTGMQPSEVAELLRVGLGPRTAEQTQAAGDAGFSLEHPVGHDVLRDPAVRVEVREVNSRRLSVFGQVQHPGVFPHQQCLTLTQAISLAGGFTALAEKNQVRVTRHDRDGRRRTFVLRAEDIAEGRAPDFDIEPDDVIFIPESIT